VSDATLVLATSASRPEYKRDFLTCLASPDGHRVAFSYQKCWFDPALLEGLVGRGAVIVFSEPAPRQAPVSFLAVRHVTISALVPARTEKLLPSTTITVEFTLGRLVGVDDQELGHRCTQWQSAINGVPGHPGSSDSPQRFVFEVPKLAENREIDQATSWRTLSVALGDCPTLHDAFFFRVSPIRRPPPRTVFRDPTTTRSVGSPPPEPVEAETVAIESFGALSQVYALATSTDYELPLDAYSPSGDVPYSQAIATTSSSDSLTVQAVTQSAAGRASQAVLVIRTGEVFRREIGTVIISGAPTFEHRVPRVEIAAEISRNILVVVALAVGIALSVFAAGLAKGTFGAGKGLSYTINIVGSLSAAVLTLLAIGRGVTK
jgi:hypothetical protein